MLKAPDFKKENLTQIFPFKAYLVCELLGLYGA